MPATTRTDHTIEELRFRHPEAGELRVPRIRYPYPLEFNRHYSEVKDRHQAWYLSFGTSETEDRAKADVAQDLAAMCALAYAHCPPEKLRVIADYSAAIALRDDRFDDVVNAERTQLHDACIRSFRTSYAGDDTAWGRMFRDIDTRFTSELTPVQYRRWRGNFQNYMEGVVGVLDDQAHRSLADYVAYRRKSVGQRIDTSFVEYSITGLELTEDVMREPLVQDLVGCHVDCVWIMQDLLSCEPELFTGVEHNIVRRIQVEEQSSLQEAIDKAAAILHNTIDRWVDLRERARVHTSDRRQLSLFIDGLDNFTVGWGEWTRWSPRYHSRYGTRPHRVDWAARYGHFAPRTAQPPAMRTGAGREPRP